MYTHVFLLHWPEKSVIGFKMLIEGSALNFRGITRMLATLVGVCLFIFALTGWLYTVNTIKEPTYEQLQSEGNGIETSCNMTDTILRLEKYKQQRNELSRDLNEVKRDLSMVSCELAALKPPPKAKGNVPYYDNMRVSQTGGWCFNESLPDGQAHMTDIQLAREMAALFAGKTVVSFGDGPGEYKQVVMATNKVTTYDAYDGAPYCETTSGGLVTFLDLGARAYGLPLYDWVLCLEVAEHIPMKHESIFLDNLVRHAAQGIVLSWAVPESIGLGHVNGRRLSYVISALNQHGFAHDVESSMRLQKAASMPHLKTNVQVYRRKSDVVAHPDDS